MSLNPLAYDSFPRYLASKRTVDDRAINRNVWATLDRSLGQRLAAIDRPLLVLEAAAGIGTMIDRALDWQLFAGQRTGVDYTAVDEAPDNINAAKARLEQLPPWLSLHLECADIFALTERKAEEQRYDLLVAHAFLDLLDIPRALPRLRRLLRREGLFYFSINFDGATILEPAIDPGYDAAIEAAYHRTMDERITAGMPSGDSRTGRHLFANLAAAGFTVTAAGSSDWVVHAVDGRYPADEAYFLHFIVATIHGALHGDPTVGGARLDDWTAARHAQIERGELVYIAHQLDFTGNVSHAPM